MSKKYQAIKTRDRDNIPINNYSDDVAKKWHKDAEFYKQRCEKLVNVIQFALEQYTPGMTRTILTKAITEYDTGSQELSGDKK